MIKALTRCTLELDGVAKVFDPGDEVLVILSAGYCIAPLEPTQEMVRAVKWVSGGWVKGQVYATETYRAMIAARPEQL